MSDNQQPDQEPNQESESTELPIEAGVEMDPIDNQANIPQVQMGNDGTLSTISILNQQIQQMDNSVLFQRPLLENIANMLGASHQTSMFENVVNQPQCMQVIDAFYTKKKSDLETIVFTLMKTYDELNLKVNLNYLEKIMRILKSKQKSILITKEVEQCTCQHDSEHHHDHQQSEQQQVDEQVQDNTVVELTNNNTNQEVVNNHSDVETQTILFEQEQVVMVEQVEQVEQIVMVEQVEQSINQDVNQQYSDDVIIVDHNNNNENTFATLEESVETLKDSIAKSREQIESLTSQRDALLQRSHELAQKQLELQHQKQLLVSQIQNEPQQQANNEDVLEQETRNISFTDIFGIMSLQSLNLNQLQNYDDQTNSLIFKLHNNYKVEIKGDESDLPKQLNKDSIVATLPSFIFNRQVLSYLSAYELFLTRSVCGWWKEQVKSAWPQVFKREMFEQLLAKDLRKNVITLHQLNILKITFATRLQILIRAMLELIDWTVLNEQIQSKQTELVVLRPLVAILRILNKMDTINYMHEITEELYIGDVAIDLLGDLHAFLEAQLCPLTIKQMRQLDQSLINSPEFSLNYITQTDNKNALYLTIMVNLLYYFGLFRNIIMCEQLQIEKMSEELKILDVRQNYNQNFLEGAYKKLMLRNCRDDLDEGEIDSTNDFAEAQQFLKALTNLTPTENPDPDIVIRRNKSVTKIYLDVNTKLDILVSSIEQFKLSPTNNHKECQTE